MGQVPAPQRYLIIGNGRTARHFMHYFNREYIPCETWSRSDSPQELRKRAKISTHALILLSDPAIEPFLTENPFLASLVCLHFSGSLLTDKAIGAHPLMTFSYDLYDLETYRKIPFIIEKGTEFQHALPGLKNPHFEIAREDKTRYHALCVLSGNFSILLWEKAFADFETRLGLPRSVLFPYLERVSSNLRAADGSVLTGPLKRGDQVTIQRHLSALENDPFQKVYEAFVDCYQSSQDNQERSPGETNEIHT